MGPESAGGGTVKQLAGVIKFPEERGRAPVALFTLLQPFALLALATIVRDHRPVPTMDDGPLSSLGLFVEFTSIAPLALLFTVMALVGLIALDPDISLVARAKECALILKVFAVAVLLLGAELVWYGMWKGAWEMFGPMAALLVLDLALAYLILRFLDANGFDGRIRETAPNSRLD